ncbi:glycosyltransferase [Dactylosporangium matsuzakiense]|uniref:Glycosyl transferase n=1 Tax=Dactylosporangium matsuzakiense TaxID=53360 RepID=A0A9W6KJF3_9ACTN|nr:glycosyltransferase [Dactylosporangium matsuzakiense]UWZ47304.1 glycosyltransferase family 1 protein [Dactylosporangium matsuzakiense]GLL01356.1 glycosyl transferase [Dactylosporangium matsuzakiense]
MSRFLFLSLPLIGHVNPMAAVAAALIRRGHAVQWAGSESFLRPLLGAGADIHPIPLRAHRGQAERGLDATRTRWAGYIVPHAKVTRKGVEAAVEAFRPDVLVVDQHAIAGAIVANARGLRWVSAAPTTMELTRPFRRGLPGVETWIHGRIAEAWTAAGQPGSPPHDLRFSPYGTIAFTAGALAGDPAGFPAPSESTVDLVGPSLAARESGPEFPMDWLDPGRRHVLVTMGTLSMDIAKDFYRRVDEALQPLGDRLQAIVVAPERTLDSVADHVLVRHRVPVLDLLPHLDAVVSHGGLNTVSEALVHGVPLVIAPIKGDQALNAAAVQAAGAGVRVSFDHVRPDDLRARLLHLLDDPAWAAAARAEGDRLLAAGGAEAAATILATHHHD